MVEESNRYAHQKLGDLFKSSIMQAEMKAILGIIIIMGIVVTKLCSFLVSRLIFLGIQG